MTDQTQYMSQEKLDELKKELHHLEVETIPGLAKRIDDARQMGDLSENAEYQTAREDMSWARSHVQELRQIIENSEIIASQTGSKGMTVNLGSTILVKFNDKEKEYTIVGPQEADPLKGKISNESPIGSAFLGKKKGDEVVVQVPVGEIKYKIIEIK